MISAVVLAAGSSSRLGRPKQLLDIGAKPVLRHVVDAALDAGLDEVLVVLGHRAAEVQATLPEDPRVRSTVNPDHAQGQSTSLRQGLAALGPDCRAAVILLGDQPGVRPEAVSAVVDGWQARRSRIVQATYGGRPAHPTLLDRSVWPETDSITGDEGARALIARRPEWRATVEVGGSPPDDIDTEEDYRRVRAALQA
jgi:molybdenum cofactor cytidylyltransferase